VQVDAFLLRGGSGAEQAQQAAYGLMLVFVALVAVGDGLSQGTVLGDAALMPDKFTQVRATGPAQPLLLYADNAWAT
jgi:hypothetical protein